MNGIWQTAGIDVKKSDNSPNCGGEMPMVAALSTSEIPQNRMVQTPSSHHI